MGQLNIKHTIEMNCSAEQAWEVIGPNFLHISHWGRGVSKSWKNEDVDKEYPDAPAGGRYCEVAGFGQVDEKIIHFDGEQHEISWSAKADKLPGFISGLQNALRVEKIDQHRCRVSTNLTANTSGLWGFLFGPLLKINLSKTVRGFLDDWKVYAETGEVSATKQKERARK